MFTARLARFVTKRMFASSNAAVSPLAALRKKTGFALTNCKAALEQTNNDLVLAETWLNENAAKLGWCKTSTSPSQTVRCGLIGLKVANNRAAMAEINCDTDFVANSSLFVDLMAATLASCHSMLDKKRFLDTYTQLVLNQELLHSLENHEDGTPLENRINSTLNKVKENIVARKAICLNSLMNIQFAGCTHPANVNETHDFEYGKYGVLLAYRMRSNSESDAIETGEIARGICQHIIGIKPLKIGRYDDDVPASSTEHERCLIFQPYMHDESVTVGQLVDEHGIDLVDFKRFECGASDDAENGDMGDNRGDSSDVNEFTDYKSLQ